MDHGILKKIIQDKQSGKKSFAVLIDPDKVSATLLADLVQSSIEAKVDYFFVGGSLMVDNRVDDCIQKLKSLSTIPVVLFPGAVSQVSRYADGLLYLSLISGRNPELLIGQHVISAPMVKRSGLEIIPTGYMVIDGGLPTSVSYISNAAPIPADKKDIAMCTAMAGEMLGLQLIYMDAGSGALHPIQENMIMQVSQNIDIPLIVGGGIRTVEKAVAVCEAGADIVVIGNAIEENASLIKTISDAIHATHEL